jgi:hypothetical protein
MKRRAVAQQFATVKHVAVVDPLTTEIGRPTIREVRLTK